MQHFITPTGVEGLLTSAVMAIARSLTLPEFDLESCLSLFLRDEVSLTSPRTTRNSRLISEFGLQVLVWFHMHNKQAQDAPTHIMNNATEWVKRTSELAYTGEGLDRVSLGSKAGSSLSIC
jgi:transformation/transcription domain-associated protein